MKDEMPLRVLLVDPSLFTAPYDAALTDGLLRAGVEPTWAVRPTRPGDHEQIATQYVDAFFYRYIERITTLPPKLRAIGKGLGHGLGLGRLLWRVLKRKPAAVHFQWLVVPPLDALAIYVIGWFAPVIVTVHDTVPFNGEHLSFWQNFAFDLPLRLSDRVIVHTRAGRDALLKRGVPENKLSVIAHGPLPLHASPSTKSERVDARFTFVLFGELKSYKGIDLLIEALGLLPEHERNRARVIIAGRPRMDLSAVQKRISELGLERVVEIRAHRQSEQEMADLFAATDCFVFPYRQIDASGVYFLVKSLGKWLIASKVGIFAEDMVDGQSGALVSPGDVPALAEAIAAAISARPTPALVSSDLAWQQIGQQTRELYQASVLCRASGRRKGASLVAVGRARP